MPDQELPLWTVLLLLAALCLLPDVSQYVVEIEVILPSGWVYVREVEGTNNLYLYWVQLSTIKTVVPL